LFLHDLEIPAAQASLHRICALGLTAYLGFSDNGVTVALMLMLGASSYISRPYGEQSPSPVLPSAVLHSNLLDLGFVLMHSRLVAAASVVPAEIPYCKKKVKKLEENLTNWKSTEVASLLSL